MHALYISMFSWYRNLDIVNVAGNTLIVCDGLAPEFSGASAAKANRTHRRTVLLTFVALALMLCVRCWNVGTSQRSWYHVSISFIHSMMFWRWLKLSLTYFWLYYPHRLLVPAVLSFWMSICHGCLMNRSTLYLDSFTSRWLSILRVQGVSCMYFVIWWCLQICRGHCGVSMGPHSRCVCRFVFGFWRCCFFSWTLQRNCCWVPCVCIDVFETMRSKLHSLCVSGSWAWLARCRHSCNSSHSFFVLPCVCCRCGLCRPSWKLPGVHFPRRWWVGGSHLSAIYQRFS